MWVDRSATPGTETTAAGKPIRSSTRTTWTACTTTAAPSSPRRWPTPAWSTASWPACPYADALHLRPGIEIRSATPDGDLVVQGDLDLSRYRYASLNPHTPLTGVYGSGEVGNLVIRAGGDLQIHGSINDGFAPPRT